MKQLEGRVAVVTGAASGIGFALAGALGQRAMKIAIADVDEPALADAERALRESGVDVLSVNTDVSSYADVESLRDETLARFGAVHLLCNNAGVADWASLQETSLADWQWILGVNLWGVIHGVSAFLPVLQLQDEAHIVNTASMSGLLTSPLTGPYAASKFAVVAISETLLLEARLLGMNVGVSVLCPGFVNTGILDSARHRQEPPAGARSPEATALLDFTRQALPTIGEHPAEVAQEVVEAVCEDRFYVLTDAAMTERVKARLSGIVDGTGPELDLPAEMLGGSS